VLVGVWILPAPLSRVTRLFVYLPIYLFIESKLIDLSAMMYLFIYLFIESKLIHLSAMMYLFIYLFIY
jgi:hypothetical protein